MNYRTHYILSHADNAFNNFQIELPQPLQAHIFQGKSARRGGQSNSVIPSLFIHITCMYYVCLYVNTPFSLGRISLAAKENKINAPKIKAKSNCKKVEKENLKHTKRATF